MSRSAKTENRPGWSAGHALTDQSSYLVVVLPVLTRKVSVGSRRLVPQCRARAGGGGGGAIFSNSAVSLP